MRVAVQGIAGCFSSAAAAVLAPGAELVECQSFADVFAALRRRRAECAVVPIENSLVGVIAPVQRLLAEHPARRLAEHTLPIEQCLIIPSQVAIAEVRRLLSHPVALAQCSRFLARHPEWQSSTFFDTAGSVLEANRHDDTAAIAGAAAAAAYGARVVERGIGDREDNATRFLLIAGER
ncbi:MAG: prephenate dehydratase domain-containing protein [Terriglobales bacterium]